VVVLLTETQRLFGWLVGGEKGASSADVHIGIYHHRCAHLLDFCMDLLLLLLHCFSSCAAACILLIATSMLAASGK